MQPPHPTLRSKHADRAERASHPLVSYLFRLMDLKASNLCLSADVSTARDLLSLADQIGPSIVVLKTHHDIIAGWDYSPNTGTGAKLASLARKHGFLIFEDRKFGDIGNTVQLQYTGGAARIIEWAHIVNVNMVPGKASVTALTEAANKWKERHPYEVKTTVTVGTPRADSDDEDDDCDAPANKTHTASNGNGTGNGNGYTFAPRNGTGTSNNGDQEDIPPHIVHNAPKSNTSNPAPSSNSNGASNGNSLFGSFRLDFDGKPSLSHEGRKGSIVSVTTVTQHYEPADSPRFTKNSTGEDEVLFPGIEEAPNDRGLLILAQMSSKGNFMGPEYTQACVEAARENKSFVMGFVAQSPLNSLPEDDFINMSPGCQLPPQSEDVDDSCQIVGGDGKGQQYNTPSKLICQSGADIIIVGRGILKADDPPSEAERYRSAGWKAYLQHAEGTATGGANTDNDIKMDAGTGDHMEVDVEASGANADGNSGSSPHGMKRKRSTDSAQDSARD
ncbi:Orotidine 5'-phosphate decarboxylase [Ceratocystis fimbriata CBS 114723]|uniref:Orotidine 5'-phosphate decarboxylase n=1 Tax=Ceratocystis fimbriata CBS 114723 TaxID=1035309 RepID=A0A2C5X585_9PEZI|nr:Orotidine 5'-phosphate decarboxylase [Ceratocystis fimbriata CBS 114723]